MTGSVPISFSIHVICIHAATGSLIFFVISEFCRVKIACNKSKKNCKIDRFFLYLRKCQGCGSVEFTHFVDFSTGAGTIAAIIRGLM